jgi:RNA polymerase sigma-70 factor (ECF subfamily)
MLRAWKAAEGFEGRSSLRSWLYRIATNVCLDALRGEKRRALPMDLGPASPPVESHMRPAPAEDLWVTPIPDARVVPDNGDPAEIAAVRDSVRLAFVTALQHLPPRQRAALILCEVLKLPAAEAASVLDSSVASVNSALQRARKVIDISGVSQQSVLRDLGPHGVEEIVTRWINAWQAGDVDAIVAMLADDARYSMPPLHEWYHGPDAIRVFLTEGPLRSRWRFLPTSANGQLAFGTYLWDDDAGAYLPGGLDVLTIQNGRVAQIVAFLSADLTSYGLPASLPA